jgi:hypothetical protein
MFAAILRASILIEGFMRADWTAYRDAAAWLRDFADQKNIERGRRMAVLTPAHLCDQWERSVMAAPIGSRATNQGGGGESP